MSFERFCTRTPLRRTSSGSRGSAICTRLLTWKVALSMSVPTSKVTTVLSVPSEAVLDWKYTIPSVPESCSSIGAATVLAMVSALAPGYVVLIVTVGGEISGYCEIRRVETGNIPAGLREKSMADYDNGRCVYK